MPTLPYAKLIHEKLSVVLTFAYSLPPIEKAMQRTFHGEWKYLRKTVHEYGSENAVRACVELAAFLRLLDDAEDISGYLKQNPSDNRGIGTFGRLFKPDGIEEPLFLRDMTNKIVHAKDWQWDLNLPEWPKLICMSDDPARWTKAEIEIQALAAFCGSLIP